MSCQDAPTWSQNDRVYLNRENETKPKNGQIMKIQGPVLRGSHQPWLPSANVWTGQVTWLKSSCPMVTVFLVCWGLKWHLAEVFTNCLLQCHAVSWGNQSHCARQQAAALHMQIQSFLPGKRDIKVGATPHGVSAKFTDNEMQESEESGTKGWGLGPWWDPNQQKHL